MTCQCSNCRNEAHPQYGGRCEDCWANCQPREVSSFNQIGPVAKDWWNEEIHHSGKELSE